LISPETLCIERMRNNNSKTHDELAIAMMTDALVVLQPPRTMQARVVHTNTSRPRSRAPLLFIMRNVHRRGHFIYRRDTRAPGPSIHQRPFLAPSPLAPSGEPSPFYPLAASLGRSFAPPDETMRHATHNGGKNGSLRFSFPRAAPFSNAQPSAAARGEVDVRRRRCATS